MVGNTAPAGINIGPLATPNFRASLQTQPLNIAPYLQGINQAETTFLREEDVFNNREAIALEDYLRSGEGQYSQAANQRGSAPLLPGTNLNVDPNTYKGRMAIERSNSLLNETRDATYRTIQENRDRNGRSDRLAIARESQRLQTDMQMGILNDPIIQEATVVQRDMDEFQQRVEQARTSGDWVDLQGVAERINQARDYLNDETGTMTWDRSILNAEEYTYNEEQTLLQLDEAFKNAVGGVDEVRTMDASQLAGARPGLRGLVKLEVNKQNDRAIARELLAGQLESNPKMRRYVERRFGTTENYFNEKLDAMLRSPEDREVVKSITGENTAQQYQNSANLNAQKHRYTLEEIEARKQADIAKTKAQGSGSGEPDSTYGLDDKNAELRKYNAQLVQQGETRLLGADQIDKVNERLAAFNENKPGEDIPDMTWANVTVADDGRIELYWPGQRDARSGRRFDVLDRAAGNWGPKQVSEFRERNGIDTPIDSETASIPQRLRDLGEVAFNVPQKGGFNREVELNNGTKVQLYSPDGYTFHTTVISPSGQKKPLALTTSPEEAFQLMDRAGVFNLLPGQNTTPTPTPQQSALPPPEQEIPDLPATDEKVRELKSGPLFNIFSEDLAKGEDREFQLPNGESVVMSRNDYNGKYAFRRGTLADDRGMYSVAAKTKEEALKQALKQGVVIDRMISKENNGVSALKGVYGGGGGK